MSTGTKPPKGGTEWLRQQRAQAARGVETDPTCDVITAEDSLTEAWLRENGVKFAPKSLIPMDMVDERKSLANQARRQPLVPESVERFALSLKEGRYLGAVVVYTSGNRVIIIDGNNRFAAHKKNAMRFIPGYVVDDDTPSDLIDFLTVNANVRHGQTPDQKWRITQALHLIARGYTIEQAARGANVTPTAVSNERNIIKADERARALKISGFTDLAATVRRRLGSLTSDPVFFQAARTAVDTDIRTDEVDSFVRSIKAARSDDAQVQVIAEIAQDRKLEEQQRKAHGRTNRVSSQKINLISALGKLEHIDVAELVRQTLTDTERTEIIRRLDKSGEKLIELQIALGKAAEDG